MNLTLGLLGLLPFLTLFLGLTLTRLKSFLVAAIVLVMSLLMGFFFWEAGPALLGGAVLEGLVVAVVPIIWVIFAAVFTYLLSQETGAIEAMKQFLRRLSPDRNVQAVLIAFCLGGFLEAVAGFGTAVAIPTALLISIGFPPVRSAVIALVANSVPVAFGALGIPVIVLSQITELPVATLTWFVAVQLLPFAIFVPLALVLIANGGRRGAGASLRDALVIGFAFTVAQTAIARFLGPELVAVGGALAGLGVFALMRRVRGPEGAEARDYQPSAPLGIGKATLNYAMLLVLVLATRLLPLPWLEEAPFRIGFEIQGHPQVIDWLTTPGTLLLLSTMVGAAIQGVSMRTILRNLGRTLNRIKFSALTILSIVALAKVMGYSGIIDSVAEMLAAASGSLYPLIAPILGAIGTFVTGSDTSSNILLGQLQRQTATQAGLPVEWVVASNTSGATAGKMISPQSISVAASTVGMEHEERNIMRSTILYCVGYAVALGLYVLLVSRILS